MFKMFKSTLNSYPKAIVTVILGMCLAMAGLMLTISHTFFLRSSESWLGSVENVYLLSFDEDRYTGLPPSLATSVLNKFPEIEDYTIIKNPPDQILKAGQNQPLKSNLYITDESFLKMFELESMKGSVDKALSLPSSIILTESLAKKLYGSIDIVGENVVYNLDNPLTVNAVIPDLPANTAFNFEGLISYSSLKVIDPSGSYNNNSNYSNILLKLSPSVIPDDLHADLFRKYRKIKAHKEKETEGELIPFKELFLRGDLRDDIYDHCESSYLNFLSFFALLILIIALLNSINLYSGIIVKKQKNWVIERIHGAMPIDFLLRNIFESVLAFGIAYLLAFIITAVCLDYLSSSSLFPADNYLITNKAAICLQVLIVIILGSCAGISSSLGSLRCLVFNNYSTSKTTRFAKSRQTFFIMQLSLASLVIVATVVSILQYSYVNRVDQGFKKTNILCFDTFGMDSLKQQEFRKSLLEIPQIQNVSYSWGVPGDVRDYWGNILSVPGKQDQYISSSLIQATNSFPALMSMKLKLGSFPDDNYNFESYILNEKAMSAFGLTEQDIGVATIGMNNGKILGIVEDYNFESLHSDLAPIIIYCKPDAYNNCMLVKLNGEAKLDSRNTIDLIEEKWLIFNPELPFSYSYLTDELRKLYLEDERFFKTGLFFSFLSIFIALMGLIAISGLEGTSRSKEVAIRKVNGANTSDIFKKFSFSFAKNIITAYILAIPVSYIVSNMWLENFVFRINLSFSIWLITGIVIIVISEIALLITLLPVIKLNPIKYLGGD